MNAAAQLSAALSGRYAIEREIGRGGMATVYLARDLRHHRRVALKLLDPELGAVLGVERFLAEIRVTANLQHPNLLPLFDSGEADGLLYYVMPYVEGESLRARLEREKQLPVDEAVQLAVAVASALDYAHRHGVVHRDLKPENILLHEGQPLVADFGIALAVSNAGGARITQSGLSLGTPQYMSPEQATGDRAIDGRTDIYSLGAVLYEMLSGDPPHTGSTVQVVIAKVLTDRPRGVRTLRPAVPPHVEQAVECALEKLPADRFATAHELADALTGLRPVSIPSGVVTPASAARGPGSPRSRAAVRVRAAVPWAVAALAVAAAVWGVSRPAPPSALRTRFVIELPDSIVLRAPGPDIALSPDGSTIAISASVRGVRRVLLRRLGGLELTAVEGTEGATRATFSPDGAWIGFLANQQLKKVRVAGGQLLTIADSVSQFSWGDNDVIVYARQGGRTGLWRVAGAGGAPEHVIGPDSSRGELAYHFPYVLPGGRAALFGINTGDPASHEIAVVTLDDRRVGRLGLRGANPRFVPSGHILFGVDDVNGTVRAAPFDQVRLRLTGRDVPVLERVLVRRAGATEIAVSDNGVLAYLQGQAVRRPVLVDRTGRERVLLGDAPARLFETARLSPDGRRVALTVREAGGRFNVWVHDVTSGTLTRLTSDGRSQWPEWMPDGRRLLWVFHDGRRQEVRLQRWEGSGQPEILLGPEHGAVYAVPSADGAFIAYTVNRRESDIRVVRLDSSGDALQLVSTAGTELMPSVSPDGRWIVYQSAESGRNEVHVRPVSGAGGRFSVSTGTATEPVWSPTGREIFYRDTDNLIAATVELQPEFRVVRRDTLFANPYATHFVVRAYDVSRDGTQFLVLKYVEGEARLIVDTGWLDELRERVGARR